jgi:hypothetical protein
MSAGARRLTLRRAQRGSDFGDAHSVPIDQVEILDHLDRLGERTWEALIGIFIRSGIAAGFKGLQ